MTADLVAAREGKKEDEIALDDPLSSGDAIAPIVCWLVSDKGGRHHLPGDPWWTRWLRA
jgi:hypothetical protein